jgi:hypothetical protein
VFDKCGSLHNKGLPDFVWVPSIFQQFDAPALFKVSPKIDSSILFFVFTF